MERTEIVNTEKPSVKILIAYHKPAVLLKDDCLTPIHVGRALATESSKDGDMSEEDYKWMLENMIGDDTGENISHLNREFSEVTAIYWAWKNYDKLGDPDYIGFMHYRRLFILNNNYVKNKKADFCNMIRYDRLDKNYKINLGLNIDNILKILSMNKCIVCSNTVDSTIHQYYSNFDFIEQNYNRFCKEIKEYRIDILSHIEKYLNNNQHFWSNMFIVPKEIFFDYCEFIFSFLLHFKSKIKFYNPSTFEKRTMGYIAEILTGIYFTYIKLNKKIELISYPLYFIENTDLEHDIKPAFNDKNITVCFSSDNNYAPYLAVTIKSLIENSNKNNNYDILILEKEIKQYFKDKILLQISKYNNIKIRFINIKILINEHLSNINRGRFINHYNESIFYRYFIPQLLKRYNKVVYLDCDLIILDDIANLYNIYLENNSLGVVRDIEMHRWLKNKKIRQEKMDFNGRLGIKDSTKYFNSGVLIMNLEKIRDNYDTNKIIDITTKELINMWVGDQDILNGFFYNDVKYIDIAWNIEWIVQLKIKDWAIEIDEESALAYKNALKNPKIIHYCDIYKPWESPELELADLWWKYAKMTDFYEEIIYRNTQKISNNNINNISNINSINRFSIADFILSFIDSEKEFSITILGIRIRVKKEFLSGNNTYYKKKDKIFSIYQNNEYKRITIFGIKINIKNKKENK